MRTSFANAQTTALFALLFVLSAVNAAAIPRAEEGVDICLEALAKANIPDLTENQRNYMCPQPNIVAYDVLEGDDYAACMKIIEKGHPALQEYIEHTVCDKFKNQQKDQQKRDSGKDENTLLANAIAAGLNHKRSDVGLDKVNAEYASLNSRSVLAERGVMDVLGKVGEGFGKIGSGLLNGVTGGLLGGGGSPAPAPAPAEAAPAEAATPTAEAAPAETAAEEEDSTPDLDLTNADAIAEWIVNNADSDSVLATLALSKNSAQLVKTVKTPAFKESTFGTALTEACGGGDDEAAGDDASLERRAAKSIPGKKLSSMSSAAVLKQVSPTVLVGALNADSMDGGLVTDVASGLVAKAKFKKLVCPKPKAAKKGKGKGLGAALKGDDASADDAAGEDASADDSAAAERR